MDQRERYIVTMEDGKQITAVAKTFSEILQMFGEENICRIEKLDYEE